MTTLTIGVCKRRHLEQVAGDGLALAALLGADPGIGARRVDQRDDRQRNRSASCIRRSALR